MDCRPIKNCTLQINGAINWPSSLNNCFGEDTKTGGLVYTLQDYMKFNTTLPQKLKPYYQVELIAYQNSYAQHDLQSAWNHLERAHVIGQAYPWPHTYVHWKMLQFGFSIKSWKEVLGQIPRLLVGGVKSFVGKIPVGNTGGANVPPLKPLPIDSEIMEMFRKAGIQ